MKIKMKHSFPMNPFTPGSNKDVILAADCYEFPCKLDRPSNFNQNKMGVEGSAGLHIIEVPLSRLKNSM